MQHQMAQEPFEDESIHNSVSVQTSPFSPQSAGMYAQLSTHPIRHDRLCSITALIPDNFSLDLHNKITQHVRPSSLENYNRHFASFRQYIIDKFGINNCFPLSGVVEYFNFLANKPFKSTTLKSIRSILKDPLQDYFPEYNISKDPWITKVIQFVKCNNPRSTFNFPAWDLDLVIRMITLREDDNLAYIFKKTMFIIFLACPYRINEFRSISISTSSFSSHHILLRTHPRFCSKTHTDSYSPTPIVIQDFPECPQVCPVRLLNNYISLTNSLCRERRIERPDSLWLSTHLKPISLELIRRWVREIIFLADPRATILGTHVHSIRGQVATRLLASGASVKEILAAMNWKRESTFFRYYAILGIQSSVRAVLAGRLPEP